MRKELATCRRGGGVTCFSAAWFEGTGLLNMAATRKVYSERTNRKQPCSRSERQKEKKAHAQDNKLSCGKLSYLYKLIGNEKTRLMKVTYLVT